MDYDGGDH